MIARPTQLALCVGVLYVFLLAQSHGSPPTFDHLFPAGGQQGTTVEVTATGTFDTWPVEIWSDRDGLSIEPQGTKGKLKVTAADDAAGVYWLRLHNRDGATTLRPFIVGTLAEVAEAETNDDPRKPQQLAGSCVINGRLAKAGDVDSYLIRLVRGQTLVASMMANRILGSPMDAVIQVCDENGFVLAQNDDAGSLDPHLVFDVPIDGAYLVRTFAFPETPNSTINFAGASNFIYRLTITTGGFLEYCLPMSVQPNKPRPVKLVGWNLPAELKSIMVERGADLCETSVFHSAASNAAEVRVSNALPIVAAPDSSREKPQAVAIPCIVSGVLSKPGASHQFFFQAKKGEKIDLRVESRSLYFPLDAVIQVSDAGGELIKEVDDAAKNYDPELTFTTPQDGEYRVAIRDLHGRGGKRYAYRLALKPAEASFSLSVAADVFNLELEKELEIPVTIARQNGFTSDIAIVAVDLPAGVTADPVISQTSGANAKSIKLKLKANGAPKRGSFRVLGRVAENATITATYAQAQPVHQHVNLWLHVTEQKPAK